MKHALPVVLVVSLFAGCASKQEKPPTDSSDARATPAASEMSRDAAVLAIVYQDILTFDGPGAPRKIHVIRDDGRILVQRKACEYKITVDRALLDSVRSQAEKEGLTQDQLARAQSAAEDLVGRFEAGDDFEALPPAEIGLVYESEAASTQPRGLRFDRPICTWTPGYSADGRLALVRMSIPWSIHSGDATYLLEKQGDEWTILLRDFVWYF